MPNNTQNLEERALEALMDALEPAVIAKHAEEWPMLPPMKPWREQKAEDPEKFAEAADAILPGIRAVLAFAQPEHPPAYANSAGEGWQPITDAAKDGKLRWLLVDYRGDGDHPLEDAEIAATIGYNGLADTGEDEWKFVGWSWTQDCYVDGRGIVLACREIGFELDAPAPAAFDGGKDGPREPDPVIMIEVGSEHDRHTFTFTSRPESEAFLAGARKFTGITVTAIDERNVATAECALGGLPEMLEVNDD